MTSLNQVIEQIKSEITVDADGKGKASIRATARLAGVDQSTLSRALKIDEVLESSKLARFLTEQGIEGEVLNSFSETGIPDTALSLICSYYACEAGRYCTEQAKLVCRAFQAIGVRAWMQDVTGYQKPSPVPALTSIDRVVMVNSLAASLQMFRVEIDNPRFLQPLQDLVLDTLGINDRLNQQALPASEPQEIWLGVAERAEQIGYVIALVTQHRSQLGKYVKACGLASRKEKRLCNGTQREINLYLQSDSLDSAIIEFMDAKVLAA